MNKANFYSFFMPNIFRITKKNSSEPPKNVKSNPSQNREWDLKIWISPSVKLTSITYSKCSGMEDVQVISKPITHSKLYTVKFQHIVGKSEKKKNNCHIKSY